MPSKEEQATFSALSTPSDLNELKESITLDKMFGGKRRKSKKSFIQKFHSNKYFYFI